jgi:hypothetical protein
MRLNECAIFGVWRPETASIESKHPHRLYSISETSLKQSPHARQNRFIDTNAIGSCVYF